MSENRAKSNIFLAKVHPNQVDFLYLCNRKYASNGYKQLFKIHKPINNNNTI